MPRIIISEPGKTPQPYRLKTDREITKIGRGSDNDIVLKTGSASTYHCHMKRVDGGFILEDNDSTNGILLEDTRYEVIDLEDGITVFIGDDIELNFELSEEELDLLDEEDFEPQQRAAFPKPKKKAEPKPKAKSKPVEEDEEEDEYEEVVVRRKKKKKPAPVALDEDEEEERPKRKKRKPVALDDDEEDERPVRKKRKAISLDEDDEDEYERPKRKKRKAISLHDDEDDDDDDDRPRKSKLATGSGASSRTPSHRSSVAVAPVKAGGGAGVTILFAVLAVVFLLGGMVIRHYQDHGSFLFSKQEQGK